MTTSASAPESAKILKRTLQRAFPATAFSVTIDRGTAYGYCNVSWTDGPSEKLVEVVANRFKGQGFDGMTDCSYRIENNLPDGRRTGLRGVMCNRHISAHFARRLLRAVAEFWGACGPVPEVVETPGSRYWTLNHDDKPRKDLPERWSTYLYRASHDRTSVIR